MSANSATSCAGTTRRSATSPSPAATAVSSFQFRSAADRDQAQAVLEKEHSDLEFTTAENVDKWLLTARIGENQRREIRNFALQQNITTLRNRVNELGVAEPVIQQQGAEPHRGAAARRAGHRARQGDPGRHRDPGIPHGGRGTRRCGRPRPRAGRRASTRTATASRYCCAGQVILTGDYIVDAASGFDQQSGGRRCSSPWTAGGASACSTSPRTTSAILMAWCSSRTSTETREENGELVRTAARSGGHQRRHHPRSVGQALPDHRPGQSARGARPGAAAARRRAGRADRDRRGAHRRPQPRPQGQHRPGLQVRGDRLHPGAGVHGGLLPRVRAGRQPGAGAQPGAAGGGCCRCCRPP
jgi:hypothetical protein